MMKSKKFIVATLSLAMIASTVTMPTKVEAATKYAKSLTVSKSALTLDMGKSATVNATVKVVKKANAGVKASSSSKKIVTVKVGKVNKKGVTALTIKAVAAGKATITVKTNSKNKSKKVLSKKITVVVKNKKNPVTPAPVVTEAPVPTTIPTSVPEATNTPILPTQEVSVSPEPTATTQVIVSTSPEVTATASPEVTATASPEVTATASPVPTAAPVEDSKVTWNAKAEIFSAAYSYKDPNKPDADPQIIPLNLVRKYVTFNPWPTTVEQVNYVIENCDDPYVIAALEVVALDNFRYEGYGKYTCPSWAMWNTLMSGGGIKSGYGFELSNVNKQGIVASGFVSSEVYKYAARAYLYGATPENGYTPKDHDTNADVMNDKTKWAIMVDQYPYTGDFYVDKLDEDINSSCYYGLTKDAAGNVISGTYITLCPQRYGLTKETESSIPTVNEHSQSYRIGLVWNKKYSRWVTVLDHVKLNGLDSNLTGFTWEGGFDPYHSGMTSNNYVAPKEDDGF